MDVLSLWDFNTSKRNSQSEFKHRHGMQLLIDHTFASPYLCNPISLGADYVIHRATKYLGGHGDVMAGVVVTSLANRAKFAVDYPE